MSCRTKKYFALTAPQEAIWLDQALHPHKPIYITGQTLAIRTRLDLNLFAAALRRVVAEYDALRLRFVVQDAGIYQETTDEIAPDPTTRDFSHANDPDAAAENWIERFFWEPIEPTDFPLYRFAVIKVAADHFLWLQKYHHLIIDVTGNQLVAARISAVYNALLAGEHPPPFDAPPYRAAQEEQEKYFSSQQYLVDAAYWRSRFAELPKPIIQGDVRESDRAKSGRPARLECDLSRGDIVALREFARRQGSSVFKVMLAVAWSCFSRLYRNGDLVFGVPLGNRRTAEAKRTVGLFAKVMPFRARLDPSTSFGAALAALARDLSADLEHQQFPIDHINRVLQLRRLGRSALCDFWVNYIRSDYEFDIGGVPVTYHNLSTAFTGLWGLQVFDLGEADAIRIVLDYDRGRVEPEMATRLLRCLQATLSDAPHRLDAAIGDLPVGLDAAPESPSAPISTDELPVPAASVPRPAIEADQSAPRDEVECALARIWQRSFGGKEIGVNEDYFELGGNSLKAVLLMDECNGFFGINLPVSALFERPSTIARMAEAVRGMTGHRSTGPLVRLKDGQGTRPLLLVHPVGGTLFCYADLLARLSGDCPVYGMQAAGLQAGETLPNSVEDVAADYLRAAADLVGSASCHLAGWSFGGLVAFEMARQLAATGRPHASLMLIDTSLPGNEAAEDDQEVRAYVAGALGLDVGRSADLGGFSVTAILSAAASRPGMPALTEEQIGRMAGLVRNNRDLRRRYRPGRLRGALTLLQAALEPNACDEDFEWRQLVDGRVDVFALPATHDSIVRPPYVDEVAAILDRMLAGVSDVDAD